MKELQPMDDYWCELCSGKRGEESVSRTFLKKERKMMYALEALEGAVAVAAPILKDGQEELIQKLGVELLGRPKDSTTTLDYAIRKAKALIDGDPNYKGISAETLAKVVATAIGDTRADAHIAEFLARPEILRGLRASGALMREGDLSKRFSLFRKGYAPSLRDMIPLFRAQQLKTK